jgi:hypothetical protein
LERIIGFLVYVDRTYKPLTPFLMGLHKSIDRWMPGRDEEGWGLRQTEVEASRDSDEDSDDEGLTPLGTDIPPARVKALHRLLPDFKVMMELTATEDWRLRRVQAKSKVNILYCYGGHLEVVLNGVLTLVTECGMRPVNSVSVSKRRYLIIGSLETM